MNFFAMHLQLTLSRHKILPKQTMLKRERKDKKILNNRFKRKAHEILSLTIKRTAKNMRKTRSITKA